MSIIARGGRVTTEQPRQREEGARIGVLENIGIVAKVAEDEDPDAVAWRRAKAYEPIIEALRGKGVNDDAMRSRADVFGISIPGTDSWDYEKIYELARQRGLAVDLKADRGEFEAWHTGRQGRYQGNVERLSRDGRWYIDMPLGLIQSFRPEYGPLPGVGLPAKTIGGAIAKEAVTNMVFEGVEIARTSKAREILGNPITAEEGGVRVGLAGVAGGLLGGAVKGVELGAPAIGAKVDRMIADNWDWLPEAVRARLAPAQFDKLSPEARAEWLKSMTVDEAALPDLADALIGRANMSADERAMVDAVRRDAEIDANSPFKPGLPGNEAHRVRLDDALAALLRPVERQPRAFAPPSRPELMGGTSLSTGADGAAGGGARAQVKAKIARVESGGTANPDIAKNPLSSATGKYQFVSGTWLRYYKRRFGDQGLTDAQILAKRSDGRIQDALMDDLTADNAAFLRAIGEAETAGNLYLTHFAGQGGARKLFAADPSARAVDVLGESVGRANPWLREMSAGDVIGWAHRKMNEPAPRRAGGRSELADDGGDALYRESLQREIDRIDAETDAARAAREADDPLGDAIAAIGGRDVSIENELVPVDIPDADLPVPSKLEPDAVAAGLSDREAALMPALRAEIAGNAKLSDLQGLARRLDASEAEVRQLMQRIAATDRNLIVQGKDGRFRRVPSDNGPVDAFKYLARKGGLADNEGHDLGEIFRVAGSGKRSKYVPGVGPLIRKGGLSVDDAGEQLFAGGYLRGADGGRPTTAETIAYLEGGMKGADARRAMVPMNRLSEVDAYVAPEGLADMREHMREWANYQDAEIDADDIEALARLMLRDDIENEDAALSALVNDAVMDALNDMRYESGDYDDALARYLDTVDTDSRGERFQADAGNAGEGRARGEADGVGDGAEFAGWDRADDPLALEQADSILHDLDARDDLFGGATRDERRQALERRGEGRQSTGVDQKPVGSDGGLFDTAAAGQREMPEFYLDEGATPRSWADIAAELADDAKELEAVRACL